MTPQEYSTLIREQMEAALRGDITEAMRLSAVHLAYVKEQGEFLERVIAARLPNK